MLGRADSSHGIEVKGAAGQNCDTTCASRSGCSEEVWPQSEDEFKESGALNSGEKVGEKQNDG